MNSLKWEKNWGNNVKYRPLDHEYKIIFKIKKNWEKLIYGWNVKLRKIEEKKLKGSIL
jgi:hypothetical protein